MLSSRWESLTFGLSLTIALVTPLAKQEARQPAANAADALAAHPYRYAHKE